MARAEGALPPDEVIPPRACFMVRARTVVSALCGLRFGDGLDLLVLAKR